MSKSLEVIKGNFEGLERNDRDALIQQLMHENIKEVQNRVERLETNHNSIREEVSQVKKDLKEKITIDYGQQSALQHMKKKRVEELWKVGGEFTKVIDTKRKLHARAWSDLYRSFGVSSYRDLKAKDFEEAMNWMKVWRPQIF